jgi:hypothetical protein
MWKESHTRKKCGILEENLFSTRGNAEIHIQRALFDNREGIFKIVALGIRMVSTSLGASSLYTYFFSKKIEISSFGGISQFLKLIVFR